MALEPRTDLTPGADGHSLRKNVGYALVGNGALNACRFLVIAILAKLTTPEIVGAFDFANSVLSAPIVLFFALELRAAYVADTRNQFTFGTYRALRNSGMSAATICLALGIFLRARTADDMTLVLLMAGVCGLRLILHWAEIYWGVFQRRERLDRLARSNVMRGAALLGAFAVLVPAFAIAVRRGVLPPERLTTGPALAALAGFAAWWSIGHFVDRRNALSGNGLDLSWNWPQVGRLAAQAFPLGLVVLIIALCDAIPRAMIAAQDAGAAKLGYFGALHVITIIAGFLIIQVGTAAGNRLATYYRDDLRAFVRLALRMTGVAFVIGAAMVAACLLFGEWFLRTLYNEDYAAHYPEFTILVYAQAIVLLAGVFGFVTTQMRQFWIQVPTQLAVLACTVVAAAWLIPQDPIRGAALTALVRGIAQTVLYFACVLFGVRRRSARR